MYMCIYMCVDMTFEFSMFILHSILHEWFPMSGWFYQLIPLTDSLRTNRITDLYDRHQIVFFQCLGTSYGVHLHLDYVFFGLKKYIMYFVHHHLDDDVDSICVRIADVYAELYEWSLDRWVVFWLYAWYIFFIHYAQRAGVVWLCMLTSLAEESLRKWIYISTWAWRFLPPHIQNKIPNKESHSRYLELWKLRFVHM